MDPTLCREHLERILLEETAALARLETILEEEHRRLEERDVDGLERAGLARQEQVTALLRLEEERGSLCSMHGYATDASGLEQLAAWCDPSGSLRLRFEETALRATRCKDFNARNGALVGARLRRVEQMLGMLDGSRSLGRTYGPTGVTHGATVGRVVQLRA
ncbi:MAG: flagellar protein FlgN [Gammaproteobacteria bacterium]|nr:flagellar protein FlgN [Gammaproteobacteria bacterium]